MGDPFTQSGVTPRLRDEKEPNKFKVRVWWEESSTQGPCLCPQSLLDCEVTRVLRGRKKALSVSREEGKNWSKGWWE